MAGRVDTIISMVALQMRRQQPVILSESSDKLSDLNTFFKAAVGLLNAVNYYSLKTNKVTVMCILRLKST